MRSSIILAAAAALFTLTVVVDLAAQRSAAAGPWCAAHLFRHNCGPLVIRR